MFVNKETLSIGLWPLSGEFGPHRLDSDPVGLLIRCLDLGYINFDTAPNYGRGVCEDLLGQAIKRTTRSSIQVTTKLGNHRNQIKSFDLDNIKFTFEQTVNALGLLPCRALLHNPRQSLDEIESLVNNLRSWLPSDVSLGISLGKDSCYPASFINSLSCAQIDYNYLFKHPLEDVLMNVHARSVFGSGLLLKSGLSITSGFHSDDHRSSWVKDDRSVQLSSAVEKFNLSCQELGIPKINACLALPLCDQRVKLIVVGLKNYFHLNQLESLLKFDLPIDPASLFALRRDLSINSGF